MNRIILITVFLLAIASITSGNLYWNIQQEQAVNKAKLTIKNVQAAANSQPKETDNPIEKDKVEDEILIPDEEAVTASNNPDIKSLIENKNYYLSLFDELEVQETSKADQLLVQAKADQVSGKYTKAELITKYQDLSKKLEQNADQTFNVLYEALHADGHSTSEAKEFKTTYQARKKERIERIITKLNHM